jgi:DNA-binding transcriptional MerR regulator
MLIGELARRAGCGAGTVRYFEREGLLQAPYRSPSGYRKYTEAHLLQLNFVLHCRSLGMTHAEIRVLQGFQADPSAPCLEISELIDRQIERIREKISMLQVLEKQLETLRSCCNANETAGRCGIMKALASAAETERGKNDGQ